MEYGSHTALEKFNPVLLYGIECCICGSVARGRSAGKVRLMTKHCKNGTETESRGPKQLKHGEPLTFTGTPVEFMVEKYVMQE